MRPSTYQLKMHVAVAQGAEEAMLALFPPPSPQNRCCLTQEDMQLPGGLSTRGIST